jgi:hypothetical protein
MCALPAFVTAMWASWTDRSRGCCRGARGGGPGDIAAVLKHMERGELEIQASTVNFEGIPRSLERLKQGGVVGRIVAAL